MGCPPDPYEVAMSHSSDETKEMAEKAQSFLNQLNRSFKLLKALLQKTGNDKITDDYSHTLEKIMSGINNISINDIEKRFNWEDLPFRNNPDDVDWSIISNHLNVSKEKLKQLEISLCKTRDLLLKLYRNNKTQLPENWYKDLEDEIAAHLEHRKEDRDIQLKVLKETVAMDERYLATLEITNEHYKFFDDKIKTTIKEIERILRLTDDELLTSRDIF